MYVFTKNNKYKCIYIRCLAPVILALLSLVLDGDGQKFYLIYYLL